MSVHSGAQAGKESPLNESKICYYIPYVQHRTPIFAFCCLGAPDLHTTTLLGYNPVTMNDADREAYLLAWTTEKCDVDGESSLTFEEGWNMIKLYGLKVLSDMLQSFLLNKDTEQRKER